MTEHYYLILALILLIMSTALFLMFRRERAKVRKFELEMTDLSGVPFEKVPEPTPRDDEAYLLIETERGMVWKNFSSETVLTADYVLGLSRGLVAKIAAVYHPDIEEPVYQVSVLGLLHLFKRVAERLEGYLNKFPLTVLRDRTIAEMLLLHSGYVKVRENPVVKLLGNKFVNTARRLVWGAYNVSNPWFYGRQIVWTVGRELGMRYLLTLILTIVGEEAVQLYRGTSARKAGSTPTVSPGPDS
jgi:hypothetical protein